MNEYTKLAEIIRIPKGGIPLPIETSKQLWHNARVRILNEIAALEDKFWNRDSFERLIYPIDYPQQIILITELQEYGFTEDVAECMDIMKKAIDELNPDLTNWFNLQKKLLGLTPAEYKAVRRPEIFMESCVINHSLINVDYCNARDKDSIDPIWFEAMIYVEDVLKYMADNGYNTLIDNHADHSGNHVQTVVENKELFTYLQEKLDKIVKEYIEEGHELVQL